LEDAIDPDIEDTLERGWLDFTFGRFRGDLFLPDRGAARALDIPPAPHINDCQKDYARMLAAQYINCLRALQGNGLMVVRANYGTGILPSILGCDIFTMPRWQDTLPTARPLGGDKIKALLEQEIPPFDAGLGRHAFAIGELMREIALRYPKIGRYAHVIQPDLQGPFDAAELIWGSDIFYGVFDRPDLVHALLRRVCETYEKVIKAWYGLFPPGGYALHAGMMYRGNLMLRSDSAHNFSPEMYAEFMRPYDEWLMSRCGGGALHFCGRGDHYIAACAEIPGLYAVNMSQPEFNDPEIIFRHTVDRGIRLIGLQKEFAVAHTKRLKGLAQA